MVAERFALDKVTVFRDIDQHLHQRAFKAVADQFCIGESDIRIDGSDDTVEQVEDRDKEGDDHSGHTVADFNIVDHTAHPMILDMDRMMLSSIR